MKRTLNKSMGCGCGCGCGWGAGAGAGTAATAQTLRAGQRPVARRRQFAGFNQPADVGGRAAGSLALAGRETPKPEVSCAQATSWGAARPAAPVPALVPERLWCGAEGIAWVNCKASDIISALPEASQTHSASRASFSPASKVLTLTCSPQ